MSRALHYLRIGWTILFGVLCVLLIGLWIGSYWQFQLLLFRMNPSNDLRLVLSKGQFAFCVSAPYTPPFSVIHFRFAPHAYSSVNKTLNWLHYSVDSGMGRSVQCIFEPHNRTRSLDGSVDGRIIVIPPWLLCILPCIAATIPWLPWSTRFSLRTLLFIITAAAVGLWLFLWIARR